MARIDRRRVAYFATPSSFQAIPPAREAAQAFSGSAGPVSTTTTPKTNAAGYAENLDARSADNLAMLGYWDQVDTICRGAEAMRAARERYLPRFPDETNADYAWRLQMTKFTNVYRDVVEGLASRPFEAPVRFDMDMSNKEQPKKPKEGDPPPEPIDPDPLPDQIADFVENVDGAYNSGTEFVASVFFQAINDAVTWIFVDYPNSPATERVRSVDDERKLGIRPFWTHVLGRNVLEARSAFIAGNEVLTYCRVLETDGSVNHVRIMYRDGTGARWELWEQIKNGRNRDKWERIDQGVFSIGLIPMVPVVIGRRRGRTQYYFSAMRDAADLQIELYWQESGLKHIKTMAAFPMLAGQGVSPAKEADGKTAKPIRVAPMAALYAPPNGNGDSGSWELLEPNASSLTFLQTDVEKTIQQLRELGRNPLTAQSGNLTVVTTMVAAKKGNSAVQMWAIATENAIDIALYYTALWYGIQEAEADRIRSHLFTDFDVDGEGGETLQALDKMRSTGDLTQRTLWKEMQRRDVLSADFDPDAEELALLAEGPTDDGTMIDPETGLTIPGVPTKKPGSTPAPGNIPAN